MDVFFDERELAAGQNFIPRRESAVLACQSVAILMGPRGLGTWQQIEKDFAFDRKAREPSLPVLLPGDVDPPTGFLSLPRPLLPAAGRSRPRGAPF